MRLRERDSSMAETKNEKLAIVAKNFSLTIGTKSLIEPSNFSVNSGEKVALVGRNGSGKTTLLKTIYSLSQNLPLPEEVAMEGSLQITPGARVHYLPQDVQINFEGKVGDYLDIYSPETTQALNEFERLTQQLKKDSSETITGRLGEIISRINALGAWDYQERKKQLFEGLKLPSEYLHRDIKKISGGEATKIALVAILISRPNIVLLDEPTNNLDLHNLLFLEEWIKKEKSLGFIIVSHDREFLDRITDQVLEIEEESNRVLSFGGNYSFYRGKKEVMNKARLRKYVEAVKQKKRLTEEATRLKTKARSFETTSPEAFFRRKGAKLEKTAKRLVVKAEAKLSEAPEPEPPKIPRVEVGKVRPEKAKILSLGNFSFKYTDKTKELFECSSFSVHQGERIAIIGLNGTGKSTFLKIIVGELKATSKLDMNPRMKIGYIPQNLTLENPQENLLDYCCKYVSTPRDNLNALLGKILFTDASCLQAGNLSIGELKRVLFSIVFASAPDLLVLDEPVNHLDLQTSEMLDKALEIYQGAIVVVSHDRYFLKKLKAKRLLAIKNGAISERQIVDSKDILEAFSEFLL